MRTIVIYDPGVCQSVTRTGCAKTAKRAKTTKRAKTAKRVKTAKRAKTAKQIDVLCGLEDPGNSRNIALDGTSPHPLR